MDSTEQLKKTIILAGLAVAAFGVLLLAIQTVQQRKFWRDIDEWRTDNRFAQFLDWEREHGSGGGSES